MREDTFTNFVINEILSVQENCSYNVYVCIFVITPLPLLFFVIFFWVEEYFGCLEGGGGGGGRREGEKGAWVCSNL